MIVFGLNSNAYINGLTRMLGIFSIARVRRICANLLPVLLPAILSLTSTARAHVGLHEEIQTITRSIQENPANAQLYVERGEAYRMHGSPDSAIEDFNKALTIDQDNLFAMRGLGAAYLDQQNPGQAIVYLARSLAQDPDNVRALVMSAQASSRMGLPLEAAAYYTRAIEQAYRQGKPLPDYYLERARAYVTAGDQYIPRALQSIDEGINVLGNLRNMELYAVELETKRSDFDAALERLDKMLPETARKESLLLIRGDTLAAAGRKDEARDDYLAARSAIDALPPHRRHTQSVRQIQADLDMRLGYRHEHPDHE